MLRHCENDNTRIIYVTVYAETRHLGLKLILRYGPKNLADGLLQRKCVFHTKVLHDVCGTRLCSLERKTCTRKLLEPSTHGNVELLPECAERLYGEISEAVCGFQARHLAANFQLHFRRERTALAFTRLFHLSRWGHDNNRGHHATAEPQRPGRLCLRGSNLRLL